MSRLFHLNLSSAGLGFTIAGGIDFPSETGDTGIVIKDIHEYGAAALAGLHVGDKLLSVNGASLVDVDHATAVKLIKEAIPSLHVSLEVERDSRFSQVITVDPRVHGDRMTVARKAYRAQDTELSRLAHELGAAPELHSTVAGQYIKAAVFGGLDGIITTFAVVASVTGANLATGVVIIMGFANLVGDGISMGVGEYLSGLSEKHYAISERNREEWEFDSNPEGEIREMVDLYQEKGITEEDAESIIRLMAKYREFFIDHMLVEELSLMPPDASESPAKNGLVIFLSFMIFGLIPLLSYLVLGFIDFGSNKSQALFGIACALTAAALFTMGAIKSRFSTQSWYISGLSVLLNGGVAAGAAYLIGFGLEHLVDLGCT
eukprot:m.90867 g.90867  ORF g.90867 m.90867 type:complete len:376 (+) comp14607_c1_seq2:455-1582(+)